MHLSRAITKTDVTETESCCRQITNEAVTKTSGDTPGRITAALSSEAKLAWEQVRYYIEYSETKDFAHMFQINNIS